MTSLPPLAEESLVQMRIAHLSMIQGVISRLSGFSASAKNFCITVMAALVAVAFQKPVPALVWAGIAVPLLFALLDAYYLAQEKRFRDLYETTSIAPVTTASDMSLKPTTLSAALIFRSTISLSVGGFYLALIAGMSLLLCVAVQGPVDPKLLSANRQVLNRTNSAAGTSSSTLISGRADVIPESPKHASAALDP